MSLQYKTRRAFSMIELLIVVAIAMLLIAIAIPFIRPGLERSRLREATRQVNTFIVGAKARAAESGRPFGVRLVRSSADGTGDPNDCYRLQYVEVPPAYSGDSYESTITVGPRHLDNSNQFVVGQLDSVNPYSVHAKSGLSFSAWLDPTSQEPNSLLLANAVRQFTLLNGETALQAWDRANRVALISPGDSIRLGFQGISYLIVDMYEDVTGSNPVCRLTLAPIYGDTPIYANVAHWPVNPAAGVNQPFVNPQFKQYQVFRKPRAAGSTILELPSNTSIDLSLSGCSFSGDEFFAGDDPIDVANGAYSNTNYIDTRPVDIVFDPNGQMTNIVLRGVVNTVRGSVYLHVGRTENVYSGVGGRKGEDWSGSPSAPQNTPGAELENSLNLKNNDTFWVAIQYPTGSVLTAENLAGDLPVGTATKLSDARNLVRSGVAKGSR